MDPGGGEMVGEVMKKQVPPPRRGMRVFGGWGKRRRGLAARPAAFGSEDGFSEDVEGRLAWPWALRLAGRGGYTKERDEASAPSIAQLTFLR